MCGTEGCFASDSAAAVEQAILDGVDVINFSISGGTNPFTDPVELAFLDAYAAGVFVAASAGNDGPGAGTANHLSPWVTTVAASTQTARVPATLDLTGRQRRHVHGDGASITAGVTAPAAGRAGRQAVPGYTDDRCLARAGRPTAHCSTGKIVACQRGAQAASRRASTSSQGGGAGMVLYNPALADIETDNHWLPTVHLADGTDFLAFLAATPGVTASFAAGVKPRDGQGDVMAAFSSRGPAGSFIKPDITAPGVQILAGAHAVRRTTRSTRPARRVLPGDRRHVDVVAAHRRLGDPAQGPPPGLDAGPDQVGPDDDGDDRRRQGGPRRRRPTRSTWAPAAST